MRCARNAILSCSLVSFLLSLNAAAQEPAATSAPEYDIVIRGGGVLDGAGNPSIFADVAIKDGRFAKIGKVQGHGRQELEAHGKYVSPGWIDMMDQSGEALPNNGLAENKLMEGVTTAIAGEGGTPVPPEKLLE
jgi:N-acyl-D-amino-acid deacylase